MTTKQVHPMVGQTITLEGYGLLRDKATTATVATVREGTSITLRIGGGQQTFGWSGSPRETSNSGWRIPQSTLVKITNG